MKGINNILNYSYFIFYKNIEYFSYSETHEERVRWALLRVCLLIFSPIACVLSAIYFYLGYYLTYFFIVVAILWGVVCFIPFFLLYQSYYVNSSNHTDVIEYYESKSEWSRRKIRIIKFVLSMISMVFELVLISSAMIVSVMANN